MLTSFPDAINGHEWYGTRLEAILQYTDARTYVHLSESLHVFHERKTNLSWSIHIWPAEGLINRVKSLTPAFLDG